MTIDLTESQSHDMEAILQFIDDSTRASAFEHSWAKLEAADPSRFNIDALKTCVRLLPPTSQDESVSTNQHRIA